MAKNKTQEREAHREMRGEEKEEKKHNETKPIDKTLRPLVCFYQ